MFTAGMKKVLLMVNAFDCLERGFCSIASGSAGGMIWLKKLTGQSRFGSVSD
jgi:hypothetical protein